MEPTLLIGDALLASKFPYGYGTSSLPIQISLPESGRVFAETPKLGDVVVFRWPGDRSQAWVKRVVGLPGDRIQVQEGRPYINDELVPREAVGEGPEGACLGYLGGRTLTGSSRPMVFKETLPGGVEHEIWECSDSDRYDNTRVYTVPPESFFMMGDNRDNSSDSRVIGPVPAENFVGEALVIFISFTEDSSLFDPTTWGDAIRWGRIGMTID